MGVTGLWTVVQPCARPIKIETLNRKRLAVDASIWIYQFLKAVRDKEGNALRNSHVVGFFRRICKLLFIGIQPVFVFDGGAPALKRQTISARRSRREGRKEDAVRTAGKLLALQMQRAAEQEEQKRKDAEHTRVEEEEELPENMVYVDELQMTTQERQANRKFKKKDQYHLPDLDASFAEMGAPNDPRIMSIEELEAYARQFDTGEDINVYDFSKIDFDSPFFTSLPASDRYNILNAARLRSRLRMGYSKEQLETMFPDRMAFSRFQIERVTERNQLTQRLMNINGMNDDSMWGIGGPGRVAGEKGREYVLVKNDGVEGGWALGVVTNKEEGQESKPIDVDELGKRIKEEEEEQAKEEEEEDFEDVPIEGLNRLPKPSTPTKRGPVSTDLGRQRRALYASRRKQGSKPKRVQKEDSNSLFVTEEKDDDEMAPAEEGEDDGDLDMSDEEELQKAIAMSLQQETGDADEEDSTRNIANTEEDMRDFDDEDDHMEVFQQKRMEEARPIPKGSYRAIASTMNQRATKAAPKQVFEAQDDSASDEEMDFRGALEKADEDRTTVKKPLPKQQKLPENGTSASKPAVSQPQKPSGFSGPLPFEKLDLGSSLLGKKKMQEMQENTAGGFEKDSDKKKEDAQPLPPWFEGNLDEDIAAQKRIEAADREKARELAESRKKYQFEQPSVLRTQASREVIDVDEPEDPNKSSGVIEIDGEDGEENEEEPPDAVEEVFTTTTMGRMGDAVQAVPLQSNEPNSIPVEIDEHEQHQTLDATSRATETVEASDPAAEDAQSKQNVETEPLQNEDEQIDWSESESGEVEVEDTTRTEQAAKHNEPEAPEIPPRSPSPDFEDVEIPEEVDTTQEQIKISEQKLAEATEDLNHVSGAADQNAPVDDEADEFGFYSDSEDEELMQQLAVEAEEHGRFAAELNHKTQQENVQEYERELKQLRTQQKKDRRDADEVTHIMISECQQLLKLFGLPYITAPMEAEAQCAELVRLGLVDGIVTDDSDCFLFGGTRIYKNMFNQAKFVECYLAADLEKEFDLNRPKLIGIAQLLGSDYTEGLPGIGPVTALEILSEFPSLSDFKDWWSKVQMNEIPKAVDASNPFRKKFRRNATKLFLPPSFPDPRVDLAYKQPEVDSDPSQFQWGVPDLEALRSFLMATIGWTSERTDEVLVPVIRDMNRKLDEGTQSNITAFFTGGTGAGAYAPRVRNGGSKRMGSALDRMAQKAQRKRAGGRVEEVPSEVEAEAEDEAQAAGPAPKSRAQRKRKARRAESDDEGEDEVDTSASTQKRKKGGRSKK